MATQFPGTELPGMNAMNDTLDFVKKLWGNMQVPGMVAPTISGDDLDKRIQDLKTVESWLTVNMNMLRNTIQALEVQRATIATFEAMRDSFVQTMQNGGDTPPPAWPPSRKDTPPSDPAPPETPDAPLSNPAAWWGLLQDQFKQAVSNANLHSQKSAAPVAEPTQEQPRSTSAPSAKKPRRATPRRSQKSTSKP